MKRILEKYSVEEYLSELPNELKNMTMLLISKGNSYEDIAFNLAGNPSQGLNAKGSEK